MVDSGCGRTLIGQETLLALTQKLATRTKLVPVEYHSDSSFRFGNGATEESNRAVRIPVGVGRKVGTIDAAIISGRAPLLLGRPTLEKMNMVLDFGGRKMRFLVQDAPIPMHTNSAGQLLIDVLDFPVSKAGASSKDKPQGVQGQGEHKGSLVEVLPVGISESAPIPSVQPQNQRDLVEISSPNIPDPKILPDDVPTPVPGISRTKPPKSKITLKKKECSASSPSGLDMPTTRMRKLLLQSCSPNQGCRRRPVDMVHRGWHLTSNRVVILQILRPRRK